MLISLEHLKVVVAHEALINYVHVLHVIRLCKRLVYGTVVTLAGLYAHLTSSSTFLRRRKLLIVEVGVERSFWTKVWINEGLPFTVFQPTA